MKKVFMGICIVSITASCHAMLRTIGQLQRATHIAAQTATLGKHQLYSPVIIQAQTKLPAHNEHIYKGQQTHLKKLLTATQHKMGEILHTLNELEADYADYQEFGQQFVVYGTINRSSCVSLPTRGFFLSVCKTSVSDQEQYGLIYAMRFTHLLDTIKQTHTTLTKEWAYNAQRSDQTTLCSEEALRAKRDAYAQQYIEKQQTLRNAKQALALAQTCCDGAKEECRIAEETFHRHHKWYLRALVENE